MSGIARRSLRQIGGLRAISRTYVSAPAPPPPPPAQPVQSGKKELSSTPYTISQPPQFPPPSDPFIEQPAPAPGQVPSPARPAQEYSDTTKAVVRGVARLMGYNSKASTAIRETQRMMRGVVEAVERDRAFWYNECELPPTYQTFFQIHLLYVLILLPRLRALGASSAPISHPIPEPIDPSEPTHTSTSPASTDSTGKPILFKPDHETYSTEFLTHFFELAESEMRKVLGRGEKERIVRKYMDEMGQQWKGAGVGLDYVLGLTLSENAEERSKADMELASWVWRNLFSSRGLTPTVSSEDAPSGGREGEVDVRMAEQLESVVRFVRKEMQRLDGVDDVDVLSGDVGQWGSVRE